MASELEVSGIDELIAQLNQLDRAAQLPSFTVPGPIGQPQAQRPHGESRSELGAESFADGFPAFDMKPGLLRSPKAKIGKQGQRYIDVPMMNRQSVTGKPDIRRLSAQWKDDKGRQHGTASYKWIHPGVKPEGEAGPIALPSRQAIPPITLRRRQAIPPITLEQQPIDLSPEQAEPGTGPYELSAEQAVPPIMLTSQITELVDEVAYGSIEIAPEQAGGLVTLLGMMMDEPSLRRFKRALASPPKRKR